MSKKHKVLLFKVDALHFEQHERSVSQLEGLVYV